MSAGTFFKTFGPSDRTTTRTLLHEAIPITGSLVSGSYNFFYNGTSNDFPTREKNIKVFSHGMFQSVYDYPYASSSANHIFDISVGISANSALSKSLAGNNPTYTDPGQQKKKINVYNQMAQILMGYNTSGNIRRFDADGDFSGTSLKIDDAIFINFSRLLVKDEIKRGSFDLEMGVGRRAWNAAKATLRIRDTGADTKYFVNSPAGEYGILYASNGVGTQLSGAASYETDPLTTLAGEGGTPINATTKSTSRSCGLIFYQAGIAVLTASVFQSTGFVANEGKNQPGSMLSASLYTTAGGSPAYSPLGGPSPGPKFPKSKGGYTNFRGLLTGSTIDLCCDGIRNKFINLSFNNTTELNSSIYFCRANHNEFNYSSNPTYLDGSKIRVKGNEILTPPRSYVTTIGLYAADNELLAVAKLSEPLRKDPTNELTLRVRLDY